MCREMRQYTREGEKQVKKNASVFSSPWGSSLRFPRRFFQPEEIVAGNPMLQCPRNLQKKPRNCYQPYCQIVSHVKAYHAQSSNLVCTSRYQSGSQFSTRPNMTNVHVFKLMLHSLWWKIRTVSNSHGVNTGRCLSTNQWVLAHTIACKLAPGFREWRSFLTPSSLSNASFP